jgi:hypothetical protein
MPLLAWPAGPVPGKPAQLWPMLTAMAYLIFIYATRALANADVRRNQLFINKGKNKFAEKPKSTGLMTLATVPRLPFLTTTTMVSWICSC